MKIITEGKTNWKYLLVVFVFAAVIGGIVLWREMRDEMPFPELSQTEMREIEFGDWRIYKNGKYGYELSYPMELSIKTEDISDFEGQDCGVPCYDLWAEKDEPQRILHKVEFFSGAYKTPVATLMVYDNANKLSLDSWLNFASDFLAEYPECIGMGDYIGKLTGNRETITVAGIDGLQGVGGCCMTCNRMIYLVRDNKVYYFYLAGYVGEECSPSCCYLFDEKTFDQMLSTFRSLD